MKVLLFALALLFTEAHGKYFWQKDKPHEELSLWKVIENGILIAADVVKNLEHSEIAERYNVKEKLEVAKANANRAEKILADYAEELWKRCDEKMYEKMPVFREKVYPILKDLDNNLEELVKKSAKEMWPVTSDLVDGLRGEFKKFWDHVADVAEKSRDRLRAEITDVRAKIEPYAEDVKAEFEKYKQGMAANLEEQAKNMKEEVEKDLEEFREKLKPYLEDLRKQIPHAQDLQKEIDNLIKNIHEYFTSNKY